MTITANPLTVADSISKLVITGVTLLDVDQVPDSAHMITPVIFPQPSGFISGIQPERVTFGTMGSQHENFTYTLNYVFLFSEIGGGLSSFAPYSAMMTKLMSVINTILNNDVVTGLVDMQLSGITGIGAIEDPAGKQYWGALFSLVCLEYAQ
jgi:hypothetical protein